MELVVLDELRELIPKLQPEERSELERSVAIEGCRDALVVWSNGGENKSTHIIIDGHNRYEICLKTGKSFSTKKLKFDSITQAKLWMIDNQMGRRNLADIDRIGLQSEKEKLLRPIAKANQKERKGNQKGTTSAKLPKLSPVDTRKECAKSAGVGERTYDAGKLVLDAADKGEIDKETVEAIRRKEKSIHRVAKDIKAKRQQAKRTDQRKEAVAKAEPQLFDNIHVGDFRENARKVPDGSLSLIFTDPPYDRKSNELFDSIGEFAASKLHEGGSLICYVGQTQIPFAIESLGNHLRYWWTLCCLHSGGANLMNEYGVRCGWKAVLWFVNGTRGDCETIVSDVMSGGREKSHHDWQQAESEAAYWIENLCPTDGIVCDPFLGGGTTAAAAIALNRKWIAMEKDHEQAVLAMGRLKK